MTNCMVFEQTKPPLNRGKQMSCDETRAARCTILHGDKFQNCFSGDYFLSQREILKVTGATVIEKKKHGSSIIEKSTLKCFPAHFTVGIMLFRRLCPQSCVLVALNMTF